MPKRVIIHAGFHKTGSSALQAFFSASAPSLAAAGIAYPYAEPEALVAAGTCSGNMVQILYREGFMHAFTRAREKPTRRMTPAFSRRVAEIVRSCDADTVLLSAEMFANAPPETIGELASQLSGERLEFVFYVRDPYEFAYSCWLQLNKDSGEKRPFHVFINRAIEDRTTLSMLTTFGRFVELGLPITLIRYERHRGNVAKGFMDATGLTAMLGGMPIHAPRQSNESISASVAAMVAVLAPHCRRDFVATFIRTAVARPRGADARYYDRDVHQKLLDQFSSEIDTLNTYLAAEDRLSTTTRPGEQKPISIASEDIELYLELALRHPPPSRTMLRRAARYPMEERLRKLIGLSPRLPPDFDGAAYLFHNPDVAAAKVDPGEHYLSVGHREDRRYRFN